MTGVNRRGGASIVGLVAAASLREVVSGCVGAGCNAPGFDVDEIGVIVPAVGTGAGAPNVSLAMPSAVFVDLGGAVGDVAAGSGVMLPAGARGGQASEPGNRSGKWGAWSRLLSGVRSGSVDSSRGARATKLGDVGKPGGGAATI